MAVQWIDNFQQYGTNDSFMLNGAYAEVNSASSFCVTDPDVTAGGTKCLKISSGNDSVVPYWGQYIRKVIPTFGTTVGMSIRLWMSALPTVDASTGDWQCPFVLTDSGNISLLTFKLTPVGSLKVFRGRADNGTLIAETSASIVANAWQHIEIKCVASATVGSVEVRVDTVVILNASGLNTGTSSFANWLAGNATNGVGGGGPSMYIKDLVIWDTTGSYNTNFIGSAFVYSMRPDSDVSGTWTITGGAGSGFASINELSPDDDTKYVSSPWPAATADIFTVSDLPADATSVKAMMAYCRSRKSDGGDGNLQVSLVSGASTGNGIDRPLTTAYTYWSDMFEADPATGVQWTVSAANAVKLKLNRTL